MSWKNASPMDLKFREIIFRLLAFDSRLLDFLFDPEEPRLRKRAGILKEDAWNLTHGEQIMLRIALELWSGSGHVFLWEIIETLDNAYLKRVIEALMELHDLGCKDDKA